MVNRMLTLLKSIMRLAIRPPFLVVLAWLNYNYGELVIVWWASSSIAVVAGLETLHIVPEACPCHAWHRTRCPGMWVAISG